MNTYNVFITTSQYEQVQARDAEEARNVAYNRWLDGNIELNMNPEFICEEADKEPA